MDAELNDLRALCDVMETELYKAHCEIERLRGLLREVIENGGATSTVIYDPSVRGYARIAWDGKEWEKRVQEALGDDAVRQSNNPPT